MTVKYKNASLVEKVIFWVFTTSFTGLIAWLSHMSLSVAALPNSTEVRRIVATESPYVVDKKALEGQMSRLEKSIDRNFQAIEKLSDAVHKRN